jgi:hypothetical integral membrane protein (TIGR02206 family)
MVRYVSRKGSHLQQLLGGNALASPAGPPARATVKWFSPEKGFGFVAVEEGAGDACRRCRAVRHDTAGLVAGATLQVRVETGQKGPQVNEVLEIDKSTAAVGPQLKPGAGGSAGRGQPTRMSGTVKWYSPEKRFIDGPDRMGASFLRFGPAHLSVIVLTVVTPLVLSAIVRCCGNVVAARIIAWSLAALLVGSEILRIVLLARDHQLTTDTAAAVYLCDWAAIAAVVTLIYPNQWTYEICYFWALAGTLQALLTPDLLEGFPAPRFISFFALHGGVIASVLYMTLGIGMRPFPLSIVRALAWSTVYLATAVAANAIFGTNYGYLRAKPAHPSLLDYMAPWPFYIGQLALLAIVSCLICYAPFFIVDRLHTK